MGLEKEKCVYCLDRLSTRKGDHVPPQTFFEEPRGFQLIQVPCCQECNVRFSKIDDLIRDLLASEYRNEKHSAVVNQIADKRNRAWDRSASRLARIEAAVRPLIVAISLAQGNFICIPTLDLDCPEMDLFMWRMGAAIMYSEFKQVVSRTDIHWQEVSDMAPGSVKVLESMLANGEPHDYGNENFSYRAVHVRGTPYGVVLMRFYGGSEFCVTFYPPAARPLKEQYEMARNTRTLVLFDHVVTGAELQAEGEAFVQTASGLSLLSLSTDGMVSITTL